ncbi:B-cell receptor CD22 isoform X2 [Antennarius striatus]
MEALSGSCLQIPCSYKAESGHEIETQGKIFGVWIKTDSKFGPFPENVIFNSSKESNTYPMSIIGNLNEKNCTTLFSNLHKNYTDIYFFRIETKQFLATASCDKLTIVVQDYPPTPQIEISSQDLKEGDLVNITCSASTPCPQFPPQISLDVGQDSDNKAKESKSGSLTMKIQEIKVSDQHDDFSITCSVGYPVNEGKNIRTVEERKTLRVLYAPKDTRVLISPSGPVSAGSWVNLTCVSRGNPPISHFMWFKAGEDGPRNVSQGPLYSFNVTDGGVYYCVAKNDLGEQKSQEINLNDEESSFTSTWQTVLGAVIGIIVLICVVVTLWWFKLKHQTQQETQSLTPGQPHDQEPGRAKEQEEIHYGVIDFSRMKSKPSSASVQDREQQQDTLYAEVNVSKKMANS